MEVHQQLDEYWREMLASDGLGTPYYVKSKLVHKKSIHKKMKSFMFRYKKKE